MKKLIINTVLFILAATALIWPNYAHADDQLQPNEVEYMARWGYEICSVIEMNPTPKNVINVAERIIGDGFQPDSAVDIINYTVQIYCDKWGPLLDETAAVYGGKGPVKRRKL